MHNQTFEMKVDFGDFGEASAEVREASGKEKLNVRVQAIWTEEMGEGMKELV